MAERTLSEEAISKMLKSAASLASSVAPECHGDSHHKLQCAMAAKHLVEAAVMLKHAEIIIPSSYAEKDQ